MNNIEMMIPGLTRMIMRSKAHTATTSLSTNQSNAVVPFKLLNKLAHIREVMYVVEEGTADLVVVAVGGSTLTTGTICPYPGAKSVELNLESGLRWAVDFGWFSLWLRVHHEKHDKLLHTLVPALSLNPWSSIPKTIFAAWLQLTTCLIS